MQLEKILKPATTKKSKTIRNIICLIILGFFGADSVGWAISYVLFFTGIAACWAGFRNARHLSVYRPFIIYLSVRTLWQIAGMWLIPHGQPTTAIENMFVLLESLLLCWQLALWQDTPFLKKICRVLMLSFAVFWLAELIYLGHLDHWFRIYYAIPLALLSLDTIARAAIGERKSVLKNPVFLAGLGMAIFSAIQVLTETTFLTNPDMSEKFRELTHWHMAILAILINIIYLKSTLCIPANSPSTSPY